MNFTTFFKNLFLYQRLKKSNLQESTGAKIVIIQETADFANEKPLRITGTPESVERAKNMVTEILNQNDVSKEVKIHFSEHLIYKSSFEEMSRVSLFKFYFSLAKSCLPSFCHCHYSYEVTCV